MLPRPYSRDFGITEISNNSGDVSQEAAELLWLPRLEGSGCRKQGLPHSATLWTSVSHMVLFPWRLRVRASPTSLVISTLTHYSILGPMDS